MRLHAILAMSLLTGNAVFGQRLADGRGDRTLLSPAPAMAPVNQVGTNGINYHNGPVMLGTTHIYYIWYGDWSTDAPANAILTNFANHIGGSPYFNINTTYTDGSNRPVSNAVTLAGSTTDTSAKTALSDSDIFAVVTRAFTNGMPVDANGVYFVLTAPGVTATSGFLTQYCGWHTAGSYSGTVVKYAFVGDAKGPNLHNCALQTSNGPNGDPSADAMVSVVAHELEETVTDPQLSAWWDDASGGENADKCAWTFGTTYAAANGSAANMKLGALDYLIQRNWVNASGGSCALSYTAAPAADYSLAISPATQTVAQGAASANYTITVNKTGGFTSTVNFQVMGLPNGATLKTAPASSATSAMFSINAPNTSAAGTYNLTVTGTSGSLSHSASATLAVTASDFSLTVSPASQSVVQGNATGNFAIAVNKTGMFNSAVNFQVTGLPTGASLRTAPAANATAATFSINVPVTVAAGTYPLTIKGTSGALNHTVLATLNVTPTNLFSLTLVPITSTVAAGTSAQYGLTVSYLSGTPAPVGLAVRGLPLGATTSLSTSSGQSATLTVLTAKSTPKGTAQFSVVGFNGTLTVTATAMLTVK